MGYGILTRIKFVGLVLSVGLISSNVSAGGNIPFMFHPLPPTVAAGCGGVLVGGFCWYLGTSNAMGGQSCTTVCATHGGYDSATETYAGSAGTNANCGAVLTALGVSGSPSDINCSGNSTGCGRDFGVAERCTDTASTSGAGWVFKSRACACQN